MDKKRLSKILKEAFAFSARDMLVTVVILFVCFIMCVILNRIDGGTGYASMLFVLAVFLVSLNTSGYLFGTLSSFLSVLLVNYFFTYPFYYFNFTLSGYPLTIFCTLVVSITTSTLTTKIKKNGDIRLLAEKEKTRSNLLRAVSHDLRTPLTTILGSTSAIIENHDSIDKEKQLRLLSEIKEEADWLIRMVENLLTVTRIDEESEARVTKSPEPCEEVVYEAVRKFRKSFGTVTLNVNVPEEFVMIPMDTMLIEQVLINLLENSAIHATGATHIDITVEYKENGAIFTVSDDGCGIPESELPSIFDIYRKSMRDTQADTKKNMGIGLSVCKTIVKAHNGELYAGNNADGGAFFSFFLPK